MAQGFDQSYNRFPMVQCPELPNPCGQQDVHNSPHTSRRQTRGGTHNCPPDTGREAYTASDNKQTYNCPHQDTHGHAPVNRMQTYCPPETNRETYHCPPDSRRETHAVPATPVRGRETYGVPPRRDDIIAPSAGGHRGTYDVPQGARRGTYGLPHTPRQGTYTPPGSGSPEIAPQYLATMCPDTGVDEERRRLKEEFRSMQSTPWTMQDVVMSPPWGEGSPPMGGITPGDTMGGFLANYPIRDDAPWDRDYDVFSSPDTAVSSSPKSKRAHPPSSRSISPQSDGSRFSPPCGPPPPSPPSPRTEYHHPTPCSLFSEQPPPTPCCPSEHPPQYPATMCPDTGVDEESRRLEEEFRSMQSTPWTMQDVVMSPPWGEGSPPMGGITPGDTMGGFLANYPIRVDAPWDRDCDVFSSPDTAVSSSPKSKRAQPPSSRSVSPQSDGSRSSPPCGPPPPSPPSPRTEYHHPTPCSFFSEQPPPTPCCPSKHPDSDSYPDSYSPQSLPAAPHRRGRSPAATPARHPVSNRTPSPSNPCSSPDSSPVGPSSGYPSSGSPGSVDTGLSSASPGTPSSRCADGTNTVKPTLEDMLCTIKFGGEDFVTDRMQHLNDINLVIMKAIDAVRTAQSRVGDFERVMDDGTTMITPFVNYWGDVAEHFGKLRRRCLDTNRPVPNLNIDHPSRQVNQGAYCDLLWQMVLASQAAERGVRAQDLEYGELDEQLNHITEWLRLTVDGLVCHIEKNKRVNEKFIQILTNFNERRRRVLAFLEEWHCGGDELNQPPLSPADRPHSPAIPEIPPHNSPSTGVFEPNPESASTPCGSPSSGGLGAQTSTGTGQQEAAVDRLRERAQALQEMVRRFNDMQSHAMHEVQNIQTQNMMLEQSLNAMENVRSPPS